MCPLSCLPPKAMPVHPSAQLCFLDSAALTFYPFNVTVIFANLIGGHVDTSRPQHHKHEHPLALAPDGNFLRVISHRSWG